MTAIAKRIVERLKREALDHRGREHFADGWAERVIKEELGRCLGVDGGQLESATGCTNRANTDLSSDLSSLGSPEGTGAPVRVEE